MNTRGGARMWLGWVVCVGVSSVGNAAGAEGVVFPADAGILNVKDLGAKGDGRQDDTAAIQAALDRSKHEGRIVYLPNGTYAISKTLRWASEVGRKKGTVLQGQSRERTIIRLKDACGGYGDPQSPRAMIWTGSLPAERFRNAVRNVTIDAGKGNAGAIGLQFMANGQGCVRDVTIRSADGKGRVGLDMTYAHEIGPLLVKNLRVVGFDFGIRTAHALNSMTFEHIEVENQSRFGFVNEGQCVTIRDLKSRNADVAVIQAQGTGLLTLIDAELTGIGAARGKPAVLCDAPIFARNVATSGYGEAIRNRIGQHQPKERRVKLFSSTAIETLFPSAARSLDLPAKEAPEVPWDEMRSWASPTHFGAMPDDDRDDSEAMQAAIDSGASTVYLPCGRYQIRKTVLLRKDVRRLIGCEAEIEVVDPGGAPAFRILDGSSRVVVIERICGAPGRNVVLDAATARTVVVRDCDQICGRMVGAGELFLEDVRSGASAGWELGRKKVWARQWTMEPGAGPIRNAGGTLWILGFKGERGGTLIETSERGKTEILGGLCQAATELSDDPMFFSRESAMSLVVGDIPGAGEGDTVVVTETRGAATRILKAKPPAQAGAGRVVLYSGAAR